MSPLERARRAAGFELLVDELRAQLLLIQRVTDAAHSRYAKDASMAMVECQWAFAAGQCRAIAEQMLTILRDAKAREP